MSILSQLMALGISEREATKVAPIVAQQRAARGVVAPHPSVSRAMENLASLKDAPHDVYNSALAQHVEDIGKTLTGPIPGGTGKGYSVGHASPNVWFTPPGADAKPLKLPRALVGEIQPGSVIHEVPREDLIKQLGGYRQDPAAVAAQTREATAAQQAEAQKLIEAARQRDMVQRAEEAIRTENAARNEAALNAELAQANALKQQGNMAQRAGAAGVEGDIVDLAALLGEKRSQVPPAVELARQTIPIPNQPTAAASAAASAPARGPWSPAPPSPTSVPSTGPLARPNQFTLNRPSIEGSVLGAAAAGGAGALAYDQATGGSLGDQFFPAPTPNEQYPTPSDVDKAMEAVTQSKMQAERQRQLQGAYSREQQNSMLNPETNAWLSANRPELVAAPISVGGNMMLGQNAPAVAATPAATPAVSRPVAANTARNVIAERAAPAPTSSNADKGPGVLSSIFSKVYDPNYQKGASQADLWKAFNEDPDNKAAYFRAARNDTGQAPSAEKRGGSVNGKDAVLHKALEIIHHMMVHGKH